MSLYKEIYDLAAKYNDYIINTRRTVHQNPELSMQEFETAAFIRKELDSMGISWKPVHETGTLGTLPATVSGGCTVALRADIDALPVNEATGLPFASKSEGKMHACGHDCHISMLLGAAKVLSSFKERPNEIKFIFQPAEEFGTGAGIMIDSGVLEGVDVIYGSHMWPDIPTGQIGLRDGPAMAGADKYFIKVKGRGGHGSEPQKCCNPIPACTSIVNGIHQVKSLSLRGDVPLTLTVGSIHCGTAMNIIPDSGEICGTIRWFDRKDQKLARERIKKIAEGSCLMYDCKAETEFTEICPCTFNTPSEAEKARQMLASMCGEAAVSTDFELPLGSEDFSFYCEKIPAVFGFVGCTSTKEHYGLHNPHFSPDEDALKMGSALYTAFALGYKKQ